MISVSGVRFRVRVSRCKVSSIMVSRVRLRVSKVRASGPSKQRTFVIADRN